MYVYKTDKYKNPNLITALKELTIFLTLFIGMTYGLMKYLPVIQSHLYNNNSSVFINLNHDATMGIPVIFLAIIIPGFIFGAREIKHLKRGFLYTAIFGLFASILGCILAVNYFFSISDNKITYSKYFDVSKHEHQISEIDFVNISTISYNHRIRNYITGVNTSFIINLTDGKSVNLIPGIIDNDGNLQELKDVLGKLKDQGVKFEYKTTTTEQQIYLNSSTLLKDKRINEFNKYAQDLIHID